MTNENGLGWFLIIYGIRLTACIVQKKRLAACFHGKQVSAALDKLTVPF